MLLRKIKFHSSVQRFQDLQAQTLMLFAYSNNGVASVLISTPLRYMHTTVEMAYRDDVENGIRLIYQAVKKLKSGHDFRYFK
jgi:putative aminopeptidase FrvX